MVAIIITLYLKKAIAILGSILAFILFFANVENLKLSINEAFEFCVFSLIPSIFIFMILSSFILYSSAFSGFLDTIPNGVFYKLGICKKYTSPILLCSFCGFVNGPMLICEDFKKNGGSEVDFSNAIILSSNAGFGFLAGCVGARIWNDALLGILLFVFQIFSSLLLGKLILKHPCQDDKCNMKNQQSAISLSSAFSRAVTSSTLTIISICAFVVVFSCFINVFLGAIGVEKDSSIYVIVNIFFEFCKGSFLAVNLENIYLSAFLSGFCIGFGGICVHFQTFSVCEGLPLDKIRFVVFKALHGVLCGLFFLVYISLSLYFK